MVPQKKSTYLSVVADERLVPLVDWQQQHIANFAAEYSDGVSLVLSRVCDLVAVFFIVTAVEGVDPHQLMLADAADNNDSVRSDASILFCPRISPGTVA